MALVDLLSRLSATLGTYEVDTSYPQAANLTALLRHDGRDFVTNAAATSVTGAKAVTTADGVMGGFGTTHGTGTTDNILTASTVKSDAATVIVFLNAKTIGGGGYGRVYQKGAGGSYNELLCFDNLATKLAVVRGTAAGGQYFDITVPGLDSTYSVAFTSTGVTAGNPPASGIAAYVNGTATTPITCGIASGATTAGATDPWRVGNRSDLVRVFDGLIGAIAVFSTAKSAGDIATILANPELLLRSVSASVSPITGELIISGNAPDVTQPGIVAPSTAQLILTGYSPLINPVSVTVTGSGVDRGTLDDSATTIAPNGLTPLIQVKCRVADGGMSAFFKVEGALGLTPFFEVDNTNWTGGTYQKFMFSYTGLPGSWTFFNTSTAPTGKYAFNHNAPFTSDTVYVSWNFPWQIGNTLPWIQSLAPTGYVSEAPSSLGTGYIFATRSATTDGSTAGVGNVVPAQPLYSFKISDGAANAPDGSPKRKMVLMAGVHPMEDVGNYMLKGACAFLTSADAAAVSIRAWFDTFVYPLTSSAGRFAGTQRSDLENLLKTADANRGWNGTGLEMVVKHKTAIDLDCGSVVHVQMDFHGDYVSGSNIDWGYINAADGSMAKTKYMNALAPYSAALLTSWATAGTTNYYFNTGKSTLYAITPEGAMRNPTTMDGKELYGEQHLRAIAKLIDQGEWGFVPITGQIVLGGYAPSIDQSSPGIYTPTTGQIVLSGNVPSVIQPLTATPITGQILLYGYAPVLSQDVTGAATLTGADLAAIEALIIARISDIAAATLAAAQVAPIHSNVQAGQSSIADAVWSKNLP